MEEKINKMKQKNIWNLKAYFLIMNLIMSVIALSVLISADVGGGGGGGTIPPGGGGGDTNIDPGEDDKGIGGDSGGDTGIVDDPDSDSTGGGGDDPGGGGDIPPIDGVDGGDGGGGGGTIYDAINSFNIQSMITKVGLGASVMGTIGSMVGGEEGSKYGMIAGAAGGAVAGIAEQLGMSRTGSLLLGLGVSVAIFVLIYSKKSTELVEFYCLPWEAPIGGGDCELCNEFEECSEYTCKSLGQACEIANPGTEEQNCFWQNPHDVNSPIIEMREVEGEHIWKPDMSIRPPATGVVISHKNKGCIKAFTPLEFTFITDEPAQCKIDYDLAKSTKEDPRAGFEEMAFYVAGSNLFVYNHTEKLSLPGPDSINAVAPELKNDGTYTLYVRCQDANGNFNQDAYSISFCVEKGPDTTPPLIVDVNIPSGNPLQYNQTSLDLEVYVNEPSECKWSRSDRDYKNMENNMDCDMNLWEMNNENVYTCRADLTGIEDRKENSYYFKCKDQPWAEEGDRNTNAQSYLYKVIGTQPLNILEILPNEETISGATDTLPVFLEIKTDNGHKNGESNCYYSNKKPESDEDYIKFLETGTNKHEQRQDLVTGDYTYYFKCVDLGGNAVYNSTTFKVKTDRSEPKIVRVYKEAGELKIITDEEAECSYSNKDCNFEIEDGIQMISLDSEIHNAIWEINKNYYIRCKDEYNNQPYPNICSIIVRPFELESAGVIEL